jgi:hypothetical protein
MPMRKARFAFGACESRGWIYAIGGITHQDTYIRSCERYDIISNKWEELPKLSVSRFSISLVIDHQSRRYLYGIGGFEMNLVRDEEIVIKLDTENIRSGWERISIKSNALMSC